MNFIESGVKNLQFSIGTAKLACAFCSQTSVSFDVQFGSQYGWVEVHFPCQGHIKVQLRAALPDEALEPSRIQELVCGFYSG